MFAEHGRIIKQINPKVLIILTLNYMEVLYYQMSQLWASLLAY